MVEIPIINKISSSRYDLGQSKVEQDKANILRGALTKMMGIAKNLVILSLELKLL